MGHLRQAWSWMKALKKVRSRYDDILEELSKNILSGVGSEASRVNLA